MALLFAFGLTSARADTSIWANLGSDYTGALNWGLTGVPANSLTADIASFGGTVILNAQPNLASSRSVAGVVFTSNAVGYVFSGAGTLSLGASGIVNNSATNQSLSLPLRLGLNSFFTTSGSGALAISGTVNTNALLLTLNGDGAGASAISGVISGTGGVTKSGAGSWTLSGVNAYSGTTTLSAGTLRATTSASALGAGALNLGGGTLELAGDTALAFNRNTTLTGATTIKVDTLTSHAGVTHTLGTLTTATTTLNVAPGSLVTANSAYGLTFGAVTLAGNPFTLAVANNGSAAGTVTLGALSNSSALGLTLNGPGTVLLNSAAGTLANGTPIVVNQGTLRFGASDALGSTAVANVTVSSLSSATAWLDLNGFTQLVASLTLGGSGATSSSLNQVTTGAGTLSLGGDLTFFATNNPLGATVSGKLALSASTSNFTVGDSTNATTDLLVSSVISGSGQLVKAGAGRLDLTGANTYTGASTLSTGTLGIGHDTALGTNSLTLTSGTVIAVGGARTLANNLIFSSGASIAFTGANSLTFNGNAALNGTDTVANSSSVTLGGVVSGTGSLTQTGSGTLILSGSNTYSGATTISGGTLRVSNTLGSATGSGTVNIGAAGTLTGTGTISGALTLSGTISPGNGGPGVLSTGDQIWTGGGHYLFEINDATGAAGTGWDKTSLTGGLTITATSGNPFVIDLTSLTALNASGNTPNFSRFQNYSWTIASVTTTISGFTGDKFIVNTSNFTNSYGGAFSVSMSGTNLLLNYAAVPETAAWSTAPMALAAVSLLRRRRRN